MSVTKQQGQQIAYSAAMVWALHCKYYISGSCLALFGTTNLHSIEEEICNTTTIDMLVLLSHVRKVYSRCDFFPRPSSGSAQKMLFASCREA